MIDFFLKQLCDLWPVQASPQLHRLDDGLDQMADSILCFRAQLTVDTSSKEPSFLTKYGPADSLYERKTGIQVT
jgi:hypothetical protein